jgi:hypothetical protein
MPLVMPNLDEWVLRQTKDKNGKEFMLITHLKESGNTHELRPLDQFEQEMEDGEPFPLNLIIEDGEIRKRTADDPSPHNDAKPIEGLEDYFLVTRNGDLYSKRTNRVVSQNLVDGNYLHHITKIGGRNGVNRAIKTSREVAKAFVPNPDNKPIVNHLNAVKIDNRDTNLEWATYKENTQHAYANNLVPILQGTEVGSSRFTEEQVREIRQLKGTMGMREIGRQYGAHHSLISDIINGKSYQNVV